MVFLDTNILLYAASRATADEEKREIARNLILENEITFSTQVVQEYTANALRKPELGIGESGANRFFRKLDQIQVIPVTLDILRQAWNLRSRHSLSHWDASILAAAVSHACPILYSEDLQNGFQTGVTKVVNPFSL